MIRMLQVESRAPAVADVMAVNVNPTTGTRAQALSATRISAISVALALHGAAMLALLLPIRHPAMQREADSAPLRVEVAHVSRPVAERPTPPPHERKSADRPVPPRTLEPTAAPEPSSQPDNLGPWHSSFETAEPAASLVVYESAPDLGLPEPDVPATELEGYRETLVSAQLGELDTAPRGLEVKIQVLVDAYGRPEAFVPAAPNVTDQVLQAVMAAVSHWRFRPATKGGKPVDSWLTLSVTI